MKLVKALKTVSRKKSVAKAVAETPAPVTKTASPEAKQASGGATSKSVTIEAKIDVGFGNTLYLRGEGQGLSWNQGIPLTCVDGATWKWTGEAKDQLKFKLLLNDAVWCQGEDLVAAPGQKLEISPAF